MKTENMSGRQLRRGEFHVATVTKLGHVGQAKKDGEYVTFHSHTGYSIVAGATVPEFGRDQIAEVPTVGSSILLFVRWDKVEGWVATGWGLYSEFVRVEKEMKATTVRRETEKAAAAKRQALAGQAHACAERGPKRGRRYPQVRVQRNNRLGLDDVLDLEHAISGGYTEIVLEVGLIPDPTTTSAPLQAPAPEKVAQ